MHVWWNRQWPETGLDPLSVTCWYRDAMARHVEPDEEVNSSLCSLSERGMLWGIVTNGSRNQYNECRAAGLILLAKFIIVFEEAGYAKPDPRTLRDALRALNLSNLAEVMFVGDNPLADIAPPDKIIERFTDLREFVNLPL